jgi:hypothetical protein
VQNAHLVTRLEPRIQVAVQRQPHAVEAGAEIGRAAGHHHPELRHTISSTWPAWAAGFTFSRIFATRPSSSMMNVVRAFPQYVLP